MMGRMEMEGTVIHLILMGTILLMIALKVWLTTIHRQRRTLQEKITKRITMMMMNLTTKIITIIITRTGIMLLKAKGITNTDPVRRTIPLTS